MPPWILLALMLLMLIGPLPKLGHIRESLGDLPLTLFALGFIAAFMLPLLASLARAVRKRRDGPQK